MTTPFRFSLVNVRPRLLSVFFDVTEPQFVELVGEVRVSDVMGRVPHQLGWCLETL